MRCGACKYEQYRMTNAETGKMEEVGDRAFLKLGGSSYVTLNRNEYEEYLYEVQLFVCPMCGTVKAAI